MYDNLLLFKYLKEKINEQYSSNYLDKLLNRLSTMKYPLLIKNTLDNDITLKHIKLIGEYNLLIHKIGTNKDDCIKEIHSIFNNLEIIAIKKIKTDKQFLKNLDIYLNIVNNKYLLNLDNKLCYIYLVKKKDYFKDKISKKIVCIEDNNFIEYLGEIFFNKNTMNLLKIQNYEKFSDLISSKEKLCNLNNKINKFSKFDKYRFLIMGSSVLFSYFVRNINDIDVYISNYDNKLNDKDIRNLTSNKLYDCTMKNSQYWKPHWNKWTIKWGESFGATNIDETVFNPKYHFYYFGLKILFIDADISRRIERERPRAYTDLLFLKNMYSHIKLKELSIPSFTYKYVKLNGLNEKEILNKTNIKYYSYSTNNNELIFKIKANKLKFLNTMNWYISTKYDKKYEIVNKNNILFLVLKK